MDEPQLGGTLLRVDMLKSFWTPYNKQRKVLIIIIMCGLFRFVFSTLFFSFFLLWNFQLRK